MSIPKENKEQELVKLIDYFRVGNYGLATQLANRLKKIYPKDVLIIKVMSLILFRENNIRAAIEVGLEALVIDDKDPELYNNMGVFFNAVFDFDKSENYFLKAIKLNPIYIEARVNYANLLLNTGKIESYIKNFDEILLLDPNNPGFRYDYATNLLSLGFLERAKEIFLEILKLDPSNTKAYLGLSRLWKFKKGDTLLSKLESLDESGGLSADRSCYIKFALAKAYEDLYEFEDAFRYYCDANKLQRSNVNYDFESHKHEFILIRNNTQKLTEVAQSIKHETPDIMPIFIIGMPRSGTTLIEQILSSHPLVTGAGELGLVEEYGGGISRGDIPASKDVLERFRADYLRNLAPLSGGKRIVCDKLPHNFRHLGLIFSVFTHVKVVHVRRDPAATCWGNFKQCFENASLGYSNSIGDTVTYFKLYAEYIQYWKSFYSDRIVEIDYEDLTVNPENEIRELIERLGLEWSDDCLSPHQNFRKVRTASSSQIRDAIYTNSSSEWKKFRPFLDGRLDNIKR